MAVAVAACCRPQRDSDLPDQRRALILRGIFFRVLGIDSFEMPPDSRIQSWNRLEKESLDCRQACRDHDSHDWNCGISDRRLENIIDRKVYCVP